MTGIPAAVRRGVYALALATIATAIYVWSDTETWSAAERMASWMWLLLFAINGLFVWFLVLTWRQRNWARWAVVVWSVLGWIAHIASFIFSDASTLDKGVQSLIVAVEVWGCLQLLSPSATSWFSPSAPTTSAL
jgi:hypothetical protein